MKFRRLRLRAALVCLALIIIGCTAFFLRKSKLPPLGEGPLIEYPSGNAAQSNVQQFLDSTFSLITDARNLPGPVLRAFTEPGGLVIANPGNDFRAGDVIYDATLPSRRLIFAGVSDKKCFVHYEHGGRGHMYLVALLEVASNDSMTPIWRGFCRGPAKGIEELRSCDQGSWRRD